MDASMRALFERYERLFNRALGGDTDMEAIAALYAPEFIGAAPAGVLAGKNDDRFREALAQGFARYRAMGTMGTKGMRVRGVRLSPLDELHCVAHVGWTATYAREGRPDTAIDFDVHYFVRGLDGEPQVFGWVTGDEQAVLEAHGIA
ncbi:MAG: hypothetical protein BGP16_00020 [Sphingobium sp. 66-54]|nr:MAG: hypothetical protein BGP16_00020 [Sphingobium sp. 66-54]